MGLQPGVCGGNAGGPLINVGLQVLFCKKNMGKNIKDKNVQNIIITKLLHTACAGLCNREGRPRGLSDFKENIFIKDKEWTT